VSFDKVKKYPVQKQSETTKVLGYWDAFPSYTHFQYLLDIELTISFLIG